MPASGACAHDERVLIQGGPAIETRGALTRISRCGEAVWGRSIAGAVTRLRHSTDQRELERIWRATGWLRDAQLFSASLAIARDRSASTPSRLYALRALLIVGRPDLAPNVEEMTAPTDRRSRAQGGCHFARRIGEPPYHGAPMPSDARAQVLSIASKLQNDQREPAAVKAAAICVAEQLR